MLDNCESFPIIHSYGESDWLEYFSHFAIADGVEWTVGLEGNCYRGSVCCVVDWFSYIS